MEALGPFGGRWFPPNFVCLPQHAQAALLPSELQVPASAWRKLRSFPLDIPCPLQFLNLDSTSFSSTSARIPSLNHQIDLTMRNIFKVLTSVLFPPHQDQISPTRRRFNAAGISDLKTLQKDPKLSRSTNLTHHCLTNTEQRYMAVSLLASTAVRSFSISRKSIQQKPNFQKSLKGS